MKLWPILLLVAYVLVETFANKDEVLWKAYNVIPPKLQSVFLLSKRGRLVYLKMVEGIILFRSWYTFIFLPFIGLNPLCPYFSQAAHKKTHHHSHDPARKALFLATHKRIEKHNKGIASWKMKHTHFSDMVLYKYTTML